MSKNLVHDARRSWWNGDITTRCGLRFPAGKGWADAGFASSTTCRECKSARKHRC